VGLETVVFSDPEILVGVEASLEGEALKEQLQLLLLDPALLSVSRCLHQAIASA
jgi:hypothetical protein